MRFIERDDFEVCAQIRTYRNRNCKLEFLLFPMVHVASPEFYAGVRSQLASCDYVLYEGINSSVGRALSASYRIMAKRPRLGLVPQREALPPSSIPGTLIHADQAAETFEASWDSLPWQTRLLVFVLSPLYGMFRYFTATRAGLARQLDRSRWRDLEPVDIDDLDHLEEVILHRRDAHLLRVLARFHAQHSDQAIKAGILFGAAHMEAVAAFLIKPLGYHTAKASRVQLFEF